VMVLLIGVFIAYSCKGKSTKTEVVNETSQNNILQEPDGSISLKVDKADCYHDEVNPSANTAEWSVKVSKSGRFNIWLSSATKDTTDLNYKDSVLLNIVDKQIHALPEVDKVVLNSGDVSYPYFRADSFLGSLYIQDTGLYNVQIISEKIFPKDSKTATPVENSKLLEVFLTPITR
jgi:hypothetical protein